MSQAHGATGERARSKGGLTTAVLASSKNLPIPRRRNQIRSIVAAWRRCSLAAADQAETESNYRYPGLDNVRAANRGDFYVRVAALRTQPDQQHLILIQIHLFLQVS